MRWLLKYWKPALATALLLALIAAWQADRRTQYRRGQADKAAEISLALAKAAQTQNENTLNQERQAQQKLHAAQAAIEKERNHAQTACAATPTYIPAACPQPPLPPAHLMKTLPEAGSYSLKARNDMRNWQKPPTPSATTLPNGRPTAQ